MSSEMHKFIKNLGWVITASIIAKFMLFIVQMVGGRVLGAQTYGNYNMIVSIASFLIMPMILASCSTALVKYVAAAKTKKEKSNLISTSKTSFLIGFSVFIAFYIAAFILFREEILGFLKIGPEIAVLSIIGTAALALYSYSEEVLKSLNKQKTLSIITLISHIFTAIVFFILIMFFRDEYLMFIPIFGGYGLYSLLSFYKTRKYLVSSPRLKLFRKMLKYNKYVFLAIISIILLGNIDKIMLNAHLGEATSVGLYQAYYISSTVITSVIVMAFINVFFPTINKFENKGPILKKLNRLMIIIVPMLVVLLPIQTYILVKYAYNFNIFPTILAAFTISTILVIANSIYGSLLISINIKSVKYYSSIIIFAALLNIGLNAYLIPKYFLTGAISATIITSFLQLTAMIKSNSKFLKRI